MSRGKQVCADVLRRKPAQWLALDEDTENRPEWARHNLVACEGRTGISCPRVQAELREKLQWCVREVEKEAHRHSDLLNRWAVAKTTTVPGFRHLRNEAESESNVRLRMRQWGMTGSSCRSAARTRMFGCSRPRKT